MTMKKIKNYLVSGISLMVCIGIYHFVANHDNRWEVDDQLLEPFQNEKWYKYIDDPQPNFVPCEPCEPACPCETEEKAPVYKPVKSYAVLRLYGSNIIRL